MTERDYFYDAIADICSYNGHQDLLKRWKEEALKSLENDEFYNDKQIREYYLEEEHTIYEMFVSRFGDWGTSIRYGWIEDIKGFVEMIDKILEEIGEEDARWISTECNDIVK